MWLHALLGLALLARAAPLHPELMADARGDVPDMVSRHGYPVQVHRVVTRDGYVLTAHRIPHGRNASAAAAPRVPVLVMHGLMCSSADFLVLGPEHALGYVLADAGYDVWLANARGNYYSRRHLVLDPDERERLQFWRFSWDEIGNHDLPALADHVTAATGQRRMHYVGYSQGTTAFLVLTALRPEYNERFLSFQALAPAAFVEHTNNPLRDRLLHLESHIERAAFSRGVGEMLPRSALITELGLRLCRDGAPLQAACARLVLGGTAHYSFNKTLLPVFLGHNPAGAALRQVIHYSQVQRFRRFARFNFDPVTNLARYGSLRPPEYDVARLRVPSFLYYGVADMNSLYQNVQLLARRIGRVATLRQVRRQSFNHFDFIWGGDARAQVYDGVVDAMRRLDAAS